ncbi:MAG: hypothetical protein ACRCYU_24045 [Nocardioides sp.]
MSEWILTPHELAATREKISKLNARAAKRGWTGRVDLVTERRESKREELGIEITEVTYRVTVGGEAPSYEGWVFLATAEWDQHAGLIVRTAPGVESVDRDALTQNGCDHCGVARRRHKTMLVRHTETGETKQVGSTCLKDFLGWDSRPVLISEDAFAEQIDMIMGGVPASESYTTESVLALAWACTMAFGFVPSRADGSTSATVQKILDPIGFRDAREAEELRAAIAPYAEPAAGKAAKVREWIASDDFDGASEYVRNLKAIAAADSVSARNIGFLASAPQAWIKAHAEELEVKVERTPSEWFGAVGEKVEFTGVIELIRWIDGTYGTTTLYSIRNEDDGRIVKWFASRDALGEEEGVTVTIKGTVKKHDEYQDVKSTVLTRCKLIEEKTA